MIAHKRIRIKNGKVEFCPTPLKYSGTYSSVNGWTDVRIITIPVKAQKDASYVYEKRGEVRSIGRKQKGEVIAINASFVNTQTGQLLGQTISDGKIIADDIKGKTEHREHLYFKDGRFGIGRIDDPSSVEFAVQAGPVIRRNGKSVRQEQIETEKIQNDIANHTQPRVAAGIKNDSLILVIVDGRGGSDRGLYLSELDVLFDHLGCDDAINLDGGGSSTLYTNIKELQQVLDMESDTHVADMSQGSPRTVHHAVVIGVDSDELLPFKGYRITSPYGLRFDPFNGQTAMHTGFDLVKVHKAPIHAFVAGRVVHAKEGVTGSGFGGFGIVVAIEDIKGYLHCYCHLYETKVKVGDVVKAGDAIGIQGSTGRSTGSHLHYEIRSKSAPSYGYGHHIEPVGYLQGWEESEVSDLPKVEDKVNVVFNNAPAPDGILINGVSYVPVRFIAESYGSKVTWDGKSKTVFIEK